MLFLEAHILIHPREAGPQRTRHGAWWTAGSILLLLLALTVDQVHAQSPPLQEVDDGDVPDHRSWESNLVVNSRISSGSQFFEAPLIDLNYGLFGFLQLKYEVPFVIKHEEDEGTSADLGNSEVGLKIKILDMEKKPIELAIYPQIAFNTRDDSVEKGLVEKGPEYIFPVIVGKQFGDWAVHTNLAYVLGQLEEDEWTYGFSVDVPLREKWELVAGVSSNSGSKKIAGIENLLIEAGFVFEKSDSRNYFFSVGFTFRNEEERRMVTASLGVQFFRSPLHLLKKGKHIIHRHSGDSQ